MSDEIKVSVFLGISLDGYIAGPDNDLSWLSIVETDPPEDTGYNALMANVDVLVMGRNTYDTVLTFGFWPYEGKQVVVLTSRPLTPLYGETSFNGTLSDLLPALATRGLKHVYLDGGNVVRQGLQQQLVDELTLSWVPATIGKGVRLFEGDMSMSQWKLTGQQGFPSGLVQARYKFDKAM